MNNSRYLLFILPGLVIIAGIVIAVLVFFSQTPTDYSVDWDLAPTSRNYVIGDQYIGIHDYQVLDFSRDLTFYGTDVTTSRSQRMVYAQPTATGEIIDSAKVHLDFYEDNQYSNAVEAMMGAHDKEADLEEQPMEFLNENYNGIDLFVTQYIDTSIDYQYSGVVGTGNAFFPDQKMIMTIYFLEADYYDASRYDRVEFMRGLVDDLMSSSQ